MSRQLVADKKEKTIAEQIIVGMLVALFMGSFIYYFFKQEGQLTSAGFDAIARQFSVKVTTIRAQWYMDKKPNIVQLSTLGLNTHEDENNAIPVNQRGWVDVSAQNLACEKIWQLVVDAPMIFMKNPITAIEVKRKSTEFGRVCQYNLASGLYFEYKSENGSVSETKLR